MSARSSCNDARAKGFRVWVAGGQRHVRDLATGETRSYELDQTPIERMFRSKTIDEEQLQAGLRFATAFEMAGLMAKPAMVSGDGMASTASGRRCREPIGGRIDANDEVAAALRHVGKMGGLVLEWVVGQGFDVKAFVQRINWNGRAMDERRAAGVLQGALSTLVVFYEGRRPLPDEPGGAN